ncbi:cation:proton antiporter [Kineobactrum sediminis]|uniref:Cation:proton antiporter n=1 Tax=Kineobactrum sediminis TaxID=1905677 RepID=A0A2N5Y1J7_9GAMM|nr:monovalent cation/H(+) antiporter subunit G [Kineobactrum sediminis]PLW82271.1 cation:proton antiporter [Kineobactrum sediminis]
MSEPAVWLYWSSWPFLLGGVFFFLAGTIGLLRFPDAYSRLHAVTKADTLGLGLLVLGLCLRSESWQAVAQMLLVWLLVMASGATACQLLARYQRESDTDSAVSRPRAEPFHNER